MSAGDCPWFASGQKAKHSRLASNHLVFLVPTSVSDGYLPDNTRPACREYQDLNACDLDVLRRVAARGCTLIAAGDDDQSIYSFRKAHPQGIRQFGSDYAGASHYPLSITLRCGKQIIEWARYVILGDPDRPYGTLMNGKAAGPGLRAMADAQNPRK